MAQDCDYPLRLIKKVSFATLFSKIELKPASGYLLKMMPGIFVKTGHGLTDLIIDATEFIFHHASNYEVNSLMFSSYKNNVTGKALIGIAPHGMGLLFSDIYPGSISDSELTEKLAHWILLKRSMSSWLIEGFPSKNFVHVKVSHLTDQNSKRGNNSMK